MQTLRAKAGFLHQVRMAVVAAKSPNQRRFRQAHVISPVRLRRVLPRVVLHVGREGEVCEKEGMRIVRSALPTGICSRNIAA